MKKIKESLLYLIMIIVPLLVLGANFKVDEGTLRFISSVTIDGYQRDFFSFFRMLILIGVAPLFFMINIGKNKNRRYMMMAGILLGCVTLSYIMSPLKEISLFGISGRYEGSLTWGAYLLIFMSLLMGEIGEKEVKKTLKILLVGTIPVWIIGFFQFLGNNPLLTDIGQRIITFLIEAPFREISGRFGAYRAYGTLGNPNYMGSYAVMLIFVSLYFVFRSRNKLTLVLSYLLYGGILFNLLGSRSRAGMMAGLGTLLLSLFMFKKNIKRDIKKILSLILLTGIIWIGINEISKGIVGDRIDVTTGGMVSLIDVKEKEGYLEVIRKRDNLYIKRSIESIDFFDGNKNQLETYIDSRKLKLSDKRYREFSFMRSNENPDLYLLMNDNGIKYEFIAIENRFYTLDHNDNVVEIPDLKRVKLFDGYERKGSSRGYLWTRTIPLIFERPLLGWGADTYSLVFPQNDYFGKVRSYGTKGILVDKPHNLYLQIVMNFGFLGLIVFVLLVGSYLLNSIKIYGNKKIETDMEYIGLFIFLGVTAYLMAGMFNDSVVCVAPFFWILMGLGVGINKNVGEEKESYYL